MLACEAKTRPRVAQRFRMPELPSLRMQALSAACSDHLTVDFPGASHAEKAAEPLWHQSDACHPPAAATSTVRPKKTTATGSPTATKASSVSLLLSVQEARLRLRVSSPFRAMVLLGKGCSPAMLLNKTPAQSVKSPTQHRWNLPHQSGQSRWS